MKAYVGLGSNLGDRAEWLRVGLAGLTAEGLAPVALSSVWETDGVGTPAPTSFLNMVVSFDTTMAPRGLLECLLGLERAAGRDRGEPNGPRTLDLDLLLLGDLVVDEPDLILPHPRMWRRRFVLEPLAEIAPDLVDPATGVEILAACRRLRESQPARRVGMLSSL